MDNGEIKHKVFIQDGDESSLIKSAVIETLNSEMVDMLCVVNVLITDDKKIRVYNRDYRGVDKATDVLSFPMQVFIKAGWDGIGEKEIDEETGDLPLGDIIISTESIERQAEEYGNTTEYETAYLIVHSTLHLLGYDHDNEANENIMHKKNKAIIKKMGFKNQ